MKNIMSSATKIVLISLVISLEVSTLSIIFQNLNNESVVTPILALFSNVIIAVISFYYGQKTGAAQAQENTQNNDV